MRMAQLDAAACGANGLHVSGIADVAARLAGGFSKAATRQDIEVAVAAALSEGGFQDIEQVRMLPGMVRAVTRTMADLWSAAITLDGREVNIPRLADIALIDRRVRNHLAEGVLAPPDLAEAALARVGYAKRLVGPITLLRLREPSPVWHPLLEALSREVELEWRGDRTPGSWFQGRLSIDRRHPAKPSRVVTCADPRSEAMEALRWIRNLLSSGIAAPHEVAVVAVDPGDWDEHMMAMVVESGLPVHFSHGVPALASADGQACAALADVLTEGLSQDRVRRLLGHLRGNDGALGALPRDALRHVAADATLATLEHWAAALETAASIRSDGFDPRVILPWLSDFTEGPTASERLGSDLLRGTARDLWMKALRQAPPQAMPFSLGKLKVPDGRDPGANVVWAPAWHLAGAPRRFVWLVGLTSGGWPRPVVGDALLPRHLLGRVLRDTTVTECDRHDFASVTMAATGALVLSRAARSAQGGVLAPSPLLATDVTADVVDRSHVPVHAYSEADRVLARPREASLIGSIALAGACTSNRQSARLGTHDGMVRARHPAIVRALESIQSATSLTRMLRDPQAFVWRYALGWHSTVKEPIALSLDEGDFGELVHELLHRTIVGQKSLGQGPSGDVEAALASAAESIAAEWPATRATPPQILWRHAIDAGVLMAKRALALDADLLPGTRSWTELRFGSEEGPAVADPAMPWDIKRPVVVPGTHVRIAGKIDRLDLLAGDRDVRLSDYKTGKTPPNAQTSSLDGGAELQRVIYAIAVLSNLPRVDRVISRLVQLADDPPLILKLKGIGDAIDLLAAHVLAADTLIRAGAALPGPDAKGDDNPFRLALPALTEGYFFVKDRAFRRAFGDFADVWRAQ
ncbi:PD-(D/E)XK nuclease family protein [Beijerinckia sp. L45]|uniref:PD-(D/E)XK nuclease family protein n=1 Tax=Beijerinckia sp. L45 TaxID=1641855 RepID=UPI00131D044F|nr:PD-(D/E)XK nuclease family protein [Beijerinckia sp. L45]